jgi:transposase-like protein
MNKRKALSVEEKVKVIREIENGKKKADVCREFGVGNLVSLILRPKRFGKTEPKLLVHSNRTDRE